MAVVDRGQDCLSHKVLARVPECGWGLSPIDLELLVSVPRVSFLTCSFHREEVS